MLLFFYFCCFCFEKFETVISQLSLISHLNCRWQALIEEFVLVDTSFCFKGEKPFACDYPQCDKKFAELSTLKKHKITHTGEGLFYLHMSCESRKSDFGVSNQVRYKQGCAAREDG